jgi:hypothetical protein
VERGEIAEAVGAFARWDDRGGAQEPVFGKIRCQ